MFKGLFFTLKREDHHSLTVERDDWLGKQHGLKIKPHSEHRDEGLGPCIPPGEAHTCILPWEGKNDNSNNNKNTFTLLPHVNRPFQQQGQRQKLSWWSPKYARPWISICHRPSAWITTTSYFFTVASNSWLSRLLACLPHVLCGPGCLSIMPTITAEGPLPGSWHICPQCEWNDIFFLQERWLYKPLILLTILKALILRISVTSWVLRTLFFCALQLSLPPSALCGMRSHLVNAISILPRWFPRSSPKLTSYPCYNYFLPPNICSFHTIPVTLFSLCSNILCPPYLCLYFPSWAQSFHHLLTHSSSSWSSATWHFQ